MNLTPREKDKLLISLAAIVARNRLERGIDVSLGDSHPTIVRVGPSAGAPGEQGNEHNHRSAHPAIVPPSP